MPSHCRVRSIPFCQSLFGTLCMRDAGEGNILFVGFSSTFQDWFTLKPGAEGKSVIPASNESQISGLLPVSSEGPAFSSFQYCCMHTKSFQSCLTLWDPMDYSPPGSSVHGILQTRIPERLPPGDLPDPGIEPLSPGAPALQEGFFYCWATEEAPWYCYHDLNKSLPGHIHIFFFPFPRLFLLFLLPQENNYVHWIYHSAVAGLNDVFRAAEFHVFLSVSPLLGSSETSGFSPRVVHLSVPL